MSNPDRFPVFDGAPLGMAQLRSVLAGPAGEGELLDSRAEHRIAAGRDVLERAMAAGQPIYGATTGVGAMKHTEHRDSAAIIAFNTGLALAHQFAVGEEMPAGIARLTVALRLNTVASGRVGVTPGFARFLAGMLARDLLPVLHGRGSAGCGDLGQMGELAAVMVGQGMVQLGGRILPTSAALAEAGLSPHVMQPREGLAAVAANAFGLARSTAAVIRASDAIRQAMGQAAVTAAAWGLDRSVWDAACQSLLPAERGIAEWLQQALADQAGWPARDSVHDALSGRFLVQILSASVEAAGAAGRSVVLHSAQVDDNPVILGDRVVTSGASLMPDLSARIAGLQLAMAQLGRNVFNRCLMLTNGSLPGLPVNLVPPGRIGTGYGPVMKLAQEQAVRLVADSVAVAPLNLSMAAGLEDEALLLPLAAERLDRQAEALEWLLTVEALLAVQALELRRLVPGRMLGWQMALVRRHVAPFTKDVPLSAPLTALHLALTAPAARAATRALAPFQPFDHEMGLPPAAPHREVSSPDGTIKKIAPDGAIQ